MLTSWSPFQDVLPSHFIYESKGPLFAASIAFYECERGSMFLIDLLEKFCQSHTMPLNNTIGNPSCGPATS